MGRHFTNEVIDKRMAEIRESRKKRHIDAKGQYRTAPTRGPRYHRRGGKPVDFGKPEMYVPEKKPGPPPGTLNYAMKPVSERPSTIIEDKLIADAISKMPPELITGRVTILAQRMQEEVRETIRKAKRRFAMNAEKYVAAHMLAVENAILEKNYEAAAKGAQWAMEKISDGGERIVEKAEVDAGGSRVMIGVNLGGVPGPQALLPQVTIEQDEHDDA